MNINLLTERLQVLNAQKQNATDRLNQAMSDLNAINGAMYECNFWINFDKQEVEPEPEQELEQE